MSGRRVRQAVRAALQGSSGRVGDTGSDSMGSTYQNSTVQNDKSSGQTQSNNNNNNKEDLSADEARELQQRRANLRARGPRQSSSSASASGVGYQDEEVEVILSGLSNIYTSYITTIEEYEVQRYGGASTLYGPHTLQAYVNQFERLARVLATTPKGQSFELTPDTLEPPDLTKSLFTLKPGVIFDSAPHGKNFGDLLADVDQVRVYQCRDLVSATFVAGNPRNDLKQEESFLYVDKFSPDDLNWYPVASDASWETKFIWERTNTLFGESKAVIQWEIPDQCQTGVYRIRHLGAHKTLLQTINHYVGKSSPFKVSARGSHQDGQPSGSNSGDQLQQADSERLDALLRLAEEVDAQATSQMSAALPANPKSDRRPVGSMMNNLYNYFNSIFRRRL